MDRARAAQERPRAS